SSKAHFLAIGKENVHMPLDYDEAKKVDLRNYLTKIEPFGKGPFPVKFKEEIVKTSGGHVIILVTTRIDETIKNTILQLTIRMKRIIVIFIQGSKQISDAELEHVRQMQFQGV